MASVTLGLRQFSAPISPMLEGRHCNLGGTMVEAALPSARLSEISSLAACR